MYPMNIWPCVKFFPKRKKVNLLLRKKAPYIVKLEHFGKNVPNFGRMDNQYMSSMIEFLKLPVFHGIMSSEEAEKELKGKDTYLIRLSSSTVGAFVISICTKKGKINHIKVDSHEGLFVAEFKIQKKEGKSETKKFSNKSFKKLVDDVVSQFKIKTVPVSSFAYIFSEKSEISLYGSTFYMS